MADLNETLARIELNIERLNNPKQLTRRWDLIAVFGGVHELASPDEGWPAHQLLSELQAYLEQNDGDEPLEFQVVPWDPRPSLLMEVTAKGSLVEGGN